MLRPVCHMVDSIKRELEEELGYPSQICILVASVAVEIAREM